MGTNHYVASVPATSACVLWGGLGAATTYTELSCSALASSPGGELLAKDGKIYTTVRFNGLSAVLAVLQ